MSSPRKIDVVYLVKAAWCSACGPMLERLRKAGFAVHPLDYERDAETLAPLRPLTTLPHLIVVLADSPEPLRFAGSFPEMRDLLAGMGAPRIQAPA